MFPQLMKKSINITNSSAQQYLRSWEEKRDNKLEEEKGQVWQQHNNNKRDWLRIGFSQWGSNKKFSKLFKTNDNKKALEKFSIET